MSATKKLIFIVFSYFLISVVLSVLYQNYRDASWLRSHVQWTYLVWSFRGPLSAAEYGWHGLAPIWKPLWTFLGGGPVVVSLLSIRVLFTGMVSARLCWLGLVLWIALAASVFGTSDLEAQVDRLIAVAADLR
jgi:hypothetical protein